MRLLVGSLLLLRNQIVSIGIAIFGKHASLQRCTSEPRVESLVGLHKLWSITLSRDIRILRKTLSLCARYIEHVDVLYTRPRIRPMISRKT